MIFLLFVHSHFSCASPSRNVHFLAAQKLQAIDGSIGNLLPSMVEDKQERRAKIRSLMEEVHNTSTNDDPILQATKISERFAKGLSL